MADAKSTITEGFRTQTEALRAFAEAQEAALRNEAPSRWFRPDGLETALSQIEELGGGYSRQELADAFLAAVRDAQQPGTVGDLALATLQGDWLAVLERTFRARHASSCRCRIQAAGRLRGHSAETGVIPGGLVGYIENIEHQTKGEFA